MALQTSAGGGPVLRVRAILRNPQGHLLAVRHQGSSYYSLPGGKVDACESAETAMARELLEEMNLVPTSLRLRYILEIPHINSVEMYFVGDMAPSTVGELQSGSHGHELEEIAFLPDFRDNFKPDLLRDIPVKDLFREGIDYLGVAHS